MSVHKHHLAQAARRRGNRSSQHQRAPRRGTHQKFLNDSQVPLPDQRNAIKNRAKQNALRQNPGRHEIQIADAAGGDRPRAVKDLAENQKPENRLNHARQQFDGIVNQFAHVGLGDGHGLAQIVRARKWLSPVVEL